MCFSGPKIDIEVEVRIRATKRAHTGSWMDGRGQDFQLLLNVKIMYILLDVFWFRESIFFAEIKQEEQQIGRIQGSLREARTGM